MKQRLTATLLILISVGIKPSLAETLQGPGLGQAIADHELRDWDIGIMPDGTGLPKGSGSVAQGKVLYEQKCQLCHGIGGVGDSGEQLAGAVNKLTDKWPEKTIGTYWPHATTLFDFTRRSMPMTQPGSLSDDETYALVAYMLFLNNLVTEETTMNAESIRNFKMPNRNGFIDVYKPK